MVWSLFTSTKAVLYMYSPSSRETLHGVRPSAILAPNHAAPQTLWLAGLCRIYATRCTPRDPLLTHATNLL